MNLTLAAVKRGIFASAALALACAGGCSDGAPPRMQPGCTSMGCANGLAVRFSRPLRQAGSYTMTLELDGARVSCRSALPFASCAVESPCSSSKVVLEQSGCALPPSAHEIVGLQIASTAKKVSLRIERDGGEVASRDFTPRYIRSAPNGTDCEPICEQASATLAMP